MYYLHTWFYLKTSVLSKEIQMDNILLYYFTIMSKLKSQNPINKSKIAINVKIKNATKFQNQR